MKSAQAGAKAGFYVYRMTLENNRMSMRLLAHSFHLYILLRFIPQIIIIYSLVEPFLFNRSHQVLLLFGMDFVFVLGKSGLENLTESMRRGKDKNKSQFSS